MSERFTPFGDIKQALPKISLSYALRVILGITFALYLLSGVYVVNPGEEAVIRRLGRWTGETLGEGIHYRLPWPVDRVDKVNVREIRRQAVGMPFAGHPPSLSPPEEAQLLTGDENIVDVKLIIQYRVKNAVDYLFQVRYEEPHKSVHRFLRTAVRAATVKLIGNMDVDNTLTLGKSLLQQLIQEEAQKLLDSYRTGLQIVTISLEEIYPPEEVADAFRDVASAKEEREERINQAESYRNNVIPDARGRAYRLTEDAKAYKIRVVNRSRGEAENFLSQLREYKKDIAKYSREVTDYRLYIETMEKVIPRTKLYIVDVKDDRKMNLRFLKQQE